MTDDNQNNSSSENSDSSRVTSESEEIYTTSKRPMRFLGKSSDFGKDEK